MNSTKRRSFLARSLVTCLSMSLYIPLALSAPQKKSPITLQELWNADASWTREYLVDICADLPNAQQVQGKLLANQAKLGDTLSPYYGQKKAQEFGRLLKEQSIITIDLINTAKRKNEKQLNKIESAWKRNACELSKFLSRTNPYITYRVFQDMLYEYLTLMLTMTTDRLSKKWSEDLQDYDRFRAQNAQLSLTLSRALDDAFPPKQKKEKEIIPPPVSVQLPAGTYIAQK